MVQGFGARPGFLTLREGLLLTGGLMSGLSNVADGLSSNLQSVRGFVLVRHGAGHCNKVSGVVTVKCRLVLVGKRDFSHDAQTGPVLALDPHGLVRIVEPQITARELDFGPCLGRVAD